MVRECPRRACGRRRHWAERAVCEAKSSGQAVARLCRYSDVGSKVMRLRYHGACVRCGAPTPAGTKAFWNASEHHVVCLSCFGSDRLPTAVRTPLPPPQPIDKGVAGGGARAVSEERAQRGRTKSQANWVKGAVGEEQLGAFLDLQLPDAVCLHDRKLPGSSSNIDHIVVTERFVCVIDAKNWSGLVERRDKGRGFQLNDRLYVSGRDHTDQVSAMTRQVEAVRTVLEPIGFGEFPVRPALCFVNSEWPLFRRGSLIDGVLVTHPRRLVKQIRKDKAPALGAAALQAISHQLSARLVAAVPAI